MPISRFFFVFLICFASTAVCQNPWQQKVDYVIDVNLNPTSNLMEGNVTITYHNNSPENLNELYIHLWPNAYGNTETAFNKQLIEDGNKKFHLSSPEEKGFIFSLDFYVNEQKANWSFNSNNIDIAKIELEKPLLSGESATITTPFVTIVPKVFSRMGRDNGQFNLTQWYPKIAMFDQDGWHPMPYVDIGEYYSNFGEYEVNITLPANYVVAATGELQNQEEIDWLNELENLTRDGVKRSYEFDLVDRFKASRTGSKTITFKQDKVTDFAWFTSPDFLYLKKPVIAEEKTVEARAFFTPDQVFLWEEQALDNIAQALAFYGEKLGPYPYAHCTAVDGPLSAGSGMEYPMITIIGPTDNNLSLKTVLIHEVGHNWFQGMLASNERRFPWMDEGLNSFYEEWALATEIGVEKLSFTESKGYYNLATSHRINQPINTHSEELTNINYFLNGYAMPAVAFNYLREYLGPEVFDGAMKNYFANWQYNHPAPKDLQATLEKQSGKSLDWFFNDLLNAQTPPDFAIKSLKANTLLVKNNTPIPMPFTIDFLDANGEVMTTEWVDGFEGEKQIELTHSLAGVNKLMIFSDELYPELTRQNNSIKTSGALPKSDGVELASIKDGLEGLTGNNQKSQLFAMPTVAWNAADHIMVGASFTNTFLNEKKVEYTAYPMYSITNKDVNGFGEVKFNLYNDKEGAIKKIQPFANVRHFNYDRFRNIELDYYHGEAGLNLQFKKPRARDGVQRSLVAKFTFNLKEPNPGFNTTNNTYFRRDFEEDWYIDLTYTRDNVRRVNPNSLSLNVQNYKNLFDAFKVYGEYKYRYDFGKTDHSLKFRAFAGVMLRNENTAPVRAYFTAMGRDAIYDYDYSNVYLDRTNGSDLANNQIYISDGGLKLKENFAFPVDVLGQWMGAMNLEAPIPVDLPLFELGVFGDVVLLQPIDIALNDDINMLYDAGLKASLGDVLKVYYPLVFSNEFKPDNDIEELTFTNKLVFSIDLNPLHIKDDVRNLLKNAF